MPAIVLYQPDIPQNTGAILRLGGCLGVPVHVIAPTGFDLSDRSLRRAGMDYLTYAALTIHSSWPAFGAWRKAGAWRLILLTTHAAHPYAAFAFADGDLLLLGRESAGVPEEVHEAADHRLTVPMVPGMRSLNVSTTAAMVLGEALRQARWT